MVIPTQTAADKDYNKKDDTKKDDNKKDDHDEDNGDREGKVAFFVRVGKNKRFKYY